jgi:hypothetical protein
VNVLRKAMAQHVEALREPLFAAYSRVAEYQFQRTPEAEAEMRRAVGDVVPLLRPFRKLLPRHKQAYLRALEETSSEPDLLPPGDFLLLFDETVYQLHVRLSPRERGLAPKPLEPWGDALVALLDERQAWRS